MYYMNLVSLARLERNPTVKTVISKGFGESIPTGFLVHTLFHKQPIIQHLKLNFVPVGNDCAND